MTVVKLTCVRVSYFVWKMERGKRSRENEVVPACKGSEHCWRILNAHSMRARPRSHRYPGAGPPWTARISLGRRRQELVDHGQHVAGAEVSVVSEPREAFPPPHPSATRLLSQIPGGLSSSGELEAGAAGRDLSPPALERWQTL